MMSPPASESPRRRFRRQRLVFVALATLALVAFAGCRQISYYGQAASGQMQIFWRQKSIEKLLADSDTPADLKRRLRVIGEARALHPVRGSGTTECRVERLRSSPLFDRGEIVVVPNRWKPDLPRIFQRQRSDELCCGAEGRWLRRLRGRSRGLLNAGMVSGSCPEHLDRPG
jgi:hypothetical protein